ncbi:BON domain-containing protein [Phenylobacterium sp.]|uniref:BON domain-containing protein n=1 Tax=Phenylobacterium sp. TaxID=1871053 RepID=UPI002DF3D9DF|nr:BON domain-containing protein [Phenylobacterium sp.]
MPRFDWRDRDADRRDARPDPREREDFGQADYSRDYGYDPEARSGYRAADRVAPAGEDYGQADYSSDWAYDPDRGPYRRSAEPDGGPRDPEGRSRDEREPRSWMGRAGDFLAGRDAAADPRIPRRRGPSDRVLWAIIVERLEDQRGLDLRDLEVLVEDAEVTLNGTVRRKEDKRRIEDIVDIDGVRHVQNNLRVRDRGHWTFL